MNFLDYTDGYGLLHVSDGESSKWWELVERLNDHWLGWDHSDDGGISGFDEFWELFSDLTSSLVHLVLDLGELASNMALSKARAQSVAAWLARQPGIGPSQVTAEGVGPLAPRDSNATPLGRIKNRRVEVLPAPAQLR